MKLVTIYLGDSIPEHFWMHIKHLLTIQVDYPIDVVTSLRIDSKPICNSRVSYFTYTPELFSSKLLDNLSIELEFREGFWRYSLERLFAFTQHHLNFPQESLMHIESDVLPLRNFPFGSFSQLNKLHWSRVDSERDVAAIIFSPSLETSNWLKIEMQKELAKVQAIDDMKLLGTISRKNSHLVEILPSAPDKSSSLLNQTLPMNKAEIKSLSSNFLKFGGIFDPAGIGIWLTGTDPRNYFGITKKFDSKLLAENFSFLNPKNVSFSLDNQGSLFFSSGDKFTQIFSLHIHSKNLTYFSNDFENQIRRDVLLSDSGRTHFSFSVKIFLNLIKENFEKGTLLSFIFWLPRLKARNILVRLRKRY